MLEVFI